MDFSAFDDAFIATLDDKGLAGASVAIVHRDLGVVHSRGYGSFAEDRAYLIASSGKVPAAGIVMRLADQGLLDLDAPIGTILGDEANPKYDITLAQLLSGSSGLPNGSSYVPYICMGVPDGTLSDCARTIYATTDDAADIIPPDTEFKYGGGQWQLAGGIAEIASGKSWAELVQETYGGPCGATSLGYTNPFVRQLQEEGALMGYPMYFGADVANLPVTDNPNIEGGAYATVPDYAKLLLMHLRGGLCGEERVLEEASVERMREDRIAMYGGVTYREEIPGYGFGWFVHRDPPGQFENRGAHGSLAWIDTERGYGVFFAIEAVNQDGTDIRTATQPTLEDVFAAGG